MFKKTKSTSKSLRKRPEETYSAASVDAAAPNEQQQPGPGGIKVTQPKEKLSRNNLNSFSFDEQEEVENEEFLGKKIKPSASPMEALAAPSEPAPSDYSAQALRNLKQKQKRIFSTKKLTQEIEKASAAGSDETESAVESTQQRSAAEVFGKASSKVPKIPTKDNILAVKKQREFLRQQYTLDQQQEEDFIRLSTDDKRTTIAGIQEEEEDSDDGNWKSRIVREEDEVGDGEEFAEDYDSERLAFGPSAVREMKEKERREFRDLVQGEDGLSEQEDSEAEEEFLEWEKQQLRKSGAQINDHQLKKMQRAPVVMPEIIQIPPYQSCLRNLQDSISQLKSNLVDNQSSIDSLRREHSEIITSIQKIKQSVQTQGEKYTFFHELQSWLSSFCNWMDEKIPQVEAIEQQLISKYANRTASAMERRRWIAIDDLCSLSGKQFHPSINIPTSIEQLRYEHQQRHLTRKLRKHPSPRKYYEEGMSTDDEFPDDMEVESTYEQLDALFADTDDAFRSFPLVLDRFKSWKMRFFKDYADAYTGFTIVGVTEIFARCSTLSVWNPLAFKKSSVLHYQELSHLDWHQMLMSYSEQFPDDAEAGVETCGDSEILGKCVEKYVIPHLQRLLSGTSVYNCYSASQTHYLCFSIEDISYYLSDEQLLEHGSFRIILESISSKVLAAAIDVLEDRNLYFPNAPFFVELDTPAFKRTFYHVLQLCCNMKHLQQRIGHFFSKIENESAFHLLERWKMPELTFGVLMILIDSGLNTFMKSGSPSQYSEWSIMWLDMCIRLAEVVPELWFEGPTADKKGKQWVGMRLTLLKFVEWMGKSVHFSQQAKQDIVRKLVSLFRRIGANDAIPTVESINSQ